MATGEKLNTWGAELNSTVFELIEDAIAGYEELTITGDVTLTSTNYATDQARMAMLDLGGTPGSAFNVTIPAQTKWYWVKNATDANATITAGGVGAVVYTGETIAVLCDGTDVSRQEISRLGQILNAGGFRIENLAAPTADAHAATKKYVDDENTAQSAAISASEAAAAASAAAASTSETNAATSETNAAASETAAAASETAAAASEAAAAASESAAATSETNAAGSASAASTSASNASTSETNAAASASAASTSASNASTSETNAASSASAASTSETNAAASAAAAAASYDSFDDRYLGAKASDPSVDNDGDALITGAIYWNTGSAIFKVWNGSTWVSLPSGTMAAQNADDVAITGGSITGITDLAVADGGTGASTASGARTNLGLAIGSDVQAYDAGLASIAGLTTAADRMIYTTASDTYAVTTLTSFGRSLLDDADAATARSTLGLGSIATQAASNVAITGGTIDGTVIGGTTPAAGAFTTLTTTGTTALGDNLYVGDGNQVLLRGVVGQIPLAFDFDTDTGIGRTSIDRLAIYCGGVATVNFDTSYVRFSPQIQAQTGSAAAPGISFDPDSDTGLFRPLTNELGFATGGSEAMRINSSGYVGIGTTSPVQALDVVGAIAVTQGFFYTDTGLVEFDIASTANTDVPITLTIPSTSWSFGIDNSNSQAFVLSNSTALGTDDKLVVTQTGNVGIGTTSPDTLLDLRPIAYTTNQLGGISLQTTGGQLRWDIAVGTSGTGAGFFRITEPSDVLGNTHTIAEHLSDEWAFHTAGSERVRIDSSGNVGIGTTSPDTILHANTGSASGTSVAGIFSGGSSGGINDEVQIQLSTNPSNADIRGAWIAAKNASGATQAHDLLFYTNAPSTAPLEAMRIDASGNVGIATTSPNVELDVNGQFATRAGAKLTISSGVITVTHSFHEIQSETVGADNLDTINGGHDGAILVLRAESGVEEAITLTNSGNIIGPVGTISGDDAVTLMYDGTRSAWIILSRT
jgi:hypothetical protein